MPNWHTKANWSGNQLLVFPGRCQLPGTDTNLPQYLMTLKTKLRLPPFHLTHHFSTLITGLPAFTQSYHNLSNGQKHSNRYQPIAQCTADQLEEVKSQPGIEVGSILFCIKNAV